MTTPDDRPLANLDAGQRPRPGNFPSPPRRSTQPDIPQPARRQAKRNHIARLDGVLAARLRAASQQQGLSYPALLGYAYSKHADALRSESSTVPSSPFSHRPTRPSLGTDQRTVQFHLTDQEYDALVALGQATGRSYAATVRELLDRYLPQSPGRARSPS